MPKSNASVDATVHVNNCVDAIVQTNGFGTSLNRRILVKMIQCLSCVIIQNRTMPVLMVLENRYFC
jgi:hypothetical protein